MPRALAGLIEKVEALCPSSLVPLVKAIAEAKGEEEFFLVCALGSIKEKISMLPLTKRFIYEIKDGARVVGLVIGAMHNDRAIDGNFFVQKDGILHETVRRVSQLFVELEFSPFVINNVDVHLMETARENKIPITSLETLAFQVQIFKEMEACPQVKAPSQKYIPLQREYAYLKGNENALEFLLKQDPPKDQAIMKSRNFEWIEGSPQLASHLKSLPSDAKPIGIVVGIGHCLGEGSIFSLLRQHGLTVIRSCRS